jgi:hypothetical protein
VRGGEIGTCALWLFGTMHACVSVITVVQKLGYMRKQRAGWMMVPRRLLSKKEEVDFGRRSMKDRMEVQVIGGIVMW